MKAVIFDLDDTLYDQIQPFQAAISPCFSLEKEEMTRLYLTFRKRADEVFEATAKGDMPLEEAHIYRMRQALQDCGLEVDADQALALQKAYQACQTAITLLPEYEAIFSDCQERQIALGVITNGLGPHQRQKIEALQLAKWIPEEQMLVSGEEGVTKPSQAIFKKLEERLELAPEDICYVGDSFENDVLGAQGAGWTAIWFNHRQKAAPLGQTADAEVSSVSELARVLRNWAEKD